MKKTLRNLVAGVIIGAASLLPMKRAEAQVKGSVEYIQSEVNDNSYPRLNMFYSLPGKIGGFTFAEFYKANKGYFARTNLNRPITKSIGPRATMIHAGKPLSQIGLGVGATVPYMPKNVSANVGLLPVWMDNEGRIVKDKIEAQYFVNANLPLGFNVNSFGNLNVAAQGGPQWEYGEISAGRNIGPFRVSYNPALLNKGNAVPKLEHRVTISLDFGSKQDKK